MKNVLLFVLMAFVAVLPIRGEEATDDSLCVNMKSITIVEKRQKAIIIPQMLMSKDLDRIRSQSVADALRFFSGVQVKDYGGIGGIKTVNIRSMGTNHVGVFVSTEDGTCAKDIGKDALHAVVQHKGRDTFAPKPLAPLSPKRNM